MTLPDAMLRDVLRIHHPIMRSETGPFSGCRCGAVQLGEDVIAHVGAELSRALAVILTPATHGHPDSPRDASTTATEGWRAPATSTLTGDEQ